VANKRALLRAAQDLAMAGDDEPVPIAKRSWFQEALGEPDPRQSVRLHARNVARMHRQAGGVVEVLHTAAGADEELRTLWRTAEQERRADAAVFIDALRRKGSLRAGLDRDSAITSYGSSPAPKRFNDSFAPVGGASPATRSGSHRRSSISFFHHLQPGSPATGGR
jgi:hypothetical protein